MARRSGLGLSGAVRRCPPFPSLFILSIRSIFMIPSQAAPALRGSWRNAACPSLRCGESSKNTLDHLALAACTRRRPPSKPRLHHGAAASRSFVSTTRSRSSSNSITTTSMTRQIADTLRLPRFQADADRMTLIQSPSSFYQTLTEMISRAKSRIFISSLYIGKDETELIDCLRSALEANRGLKVLVLVDGLRSTREGPLREDGETVSNTSCASLLASLARDFSNQVDVHLYRTPGLPVWMEKVIGKRFVEGAGLQHMKVYGADDDVIVSGANLSKDYFTNRQDRYLLVRGNEMLANYLHALLLLTCRFSYTLVGEQGKGKQHRHYAPYGVRWEEGRGLLLAEGTDGSVSEAAHSTAAAAGEDAFAEHHFALAAGKAVRLFTERWRKHTDELAAASKDPASHSTTVVPLLQMGPMSIDDETRAMPLILSYIEAQAQAAASTTSSSSAASILDITSGYFSLYPPYKSALISLPSSVHSRIIAAAPQSNGFYGSKGISGLLPAAYTWLEKRFWEDVQKERRKRQEGGGGGGEMEVGPLISLNEWEKEGWTYHAKGLWHRSADAAAAASGGQVQTLIGSSNLGSRSALRDLECSLLVETAAGDSLDQALREEIEALRRYATVEVDEEGSLFKEEERKVSWFVRGATQLIKGRL